MGEMKIENSDVWGFIGAIRGMRNPMNSWDKSDSMTSLFYGELGDNDKKLAQNLIKSGSEHAKFTRMIHVQADVTMPRYWWSEMDTYKFVEKSSCSTMHRLLNTKEPITEEQFYTKDILLNDSIKDLENLRIRFQAVKEEKKEGYAEEMNRLLAIAKRHLPEAFLQKRTIDTNYQELRNIYKQRKDHRLKEEWGFFCNWIENLPLSKDLITFGIKENYK